MTWTQAQKERIILAYGHEGEAYCPLDGTPLECVALAERGLSRGAVNLHCPTCGAELGWVWAPHPPPSNRLSLSAI